jgi:curli production assembly/transport component CsgG
MGSKFFRKITAAIILASGILPLGGCSFNALYNNDSVSKAHITDNTCATDVLIKMPQPDRSVPVVVYDFQDQTGQFKNNGTYTDYSSAVTRGGYSILVKSLLDAGNGEWFMLAERGGLKNLLQERQIIKLTRGEYNASAGKDEKKLPGLPPMLYGGTIIEGGIVSYDSNIMSGGLGATYLGIGGSTQYRRDLVTVYLRAVSVGTGRVLLSVQSSKTIYSASLDGTFMRYLTVGNLFQSEAGFAINEPVQFGVRQAIETAVYSMVMEGAMKHLWEFKDKEAGAKAIAEYKERRDTMHCDIPEAKSDHLDNEVKNNADKQPNS